MILSAIPAAKVGAAVLALATVGGGVAVEHAVSGPSTSAAHRAAPSATGQPTHHPVGPDAHGPAAFGLCNAYAHGGLPASSVPYQNLVAAAGGAGKITAYCATVAHPGHAADHPTGKPSEHPTGKPSAPSSDSSS